MQRKRGGQPGNQNAFKHGYYSRLNRQPAQGDDQAVLLGIENEIRAMRLYTRRMLDLADEIQDLPVAIKVLQALGTASTRTAMLLKTHSELAGSGGLADVLSQAIREVLEEKSVASLVASSDER